MNLVLIVTVALASFLLTVLVRRYAIHKSIIDIPNNRSSHAVPTPRGGGLAVALAWFGGLFFYFVNRNIEPSLFYALLAGLPLTLIGFADDMLSLKPGIRFLVQFICAGLGLWFLGGLKLISWPWGTLELLTVFTPLAFIAIIWAINLFNFLDGIDGYIGSEIVFIGLAAFGLTGDSFGLLLAAATFGFLIWG